MNLELSVRKNIYSLKPYSCARDEFKGEASVYMDANENPYNRPYNRYPDPLQTALKEKIARIKNVRPTQIMIGNGSDECIDLVFRIFCEPKKDAVVAIEPTYGMYKVCADINNVKYTKVLLDKNFQLDAEKLLAETDERTKAVFLCSPNNPSGNLLKRQEIQKVIEKLNGIVVIDEAYIDFSGAPSWLNELDKYPNLIVLHTFSKAWGLASVRCGLAFASEEIIALFNKVKYPYNVNCLTQRYVAGQLDEGEQFKNECVKLVLDEKEPLIKALESLKCVKKIYPSDANFLLVKVNNAEQIYKGLVEQGIIVRNRSSISLCNNCIRITIGTKKENHTLIKVLKMLDSDLLNSNNKPLAKKSPRKAKVLFPEVFENEDID
ncbi:MAG: histidinol-phosphate transaminase [Dysgonamonadaceae bacterium]|jgi:histidinol-phosphate aminotransferase|nr:histidinol-phosphate transaminase [Dysgonamonadaceae bacterium]